nr:DUF4148 domain-containing protein [Pseudomonas sp.]
MKAYLNIAALAATMIAAPAFADFDTRGEMIDYPANVSQPSNAPAYSRADVVAQIPAGGVPLGEALEYPAGYSVMTNAQPRTRAEVRAELADAVASGTRFTGGITYPDHSDYY